MEKYPSIPLNKSGVSLIKDWQTADLSKVDKLSSSEAFGLRLGDNSLASICVIASERLNQRLAQFLWPKLGGNECVLMYDLDGSVHFVHRTNTSIAPSILVDDGQAKVEVKQRGSYIATASNHQFNNLKELELLDSTKVLAIIDLIRDFLTEEYFVPRTSFVRTSTKNVYGGYKIESLAEIVNANKDKQPPKQLFGEFWRDGEIAVLFGQTNTGKTVLAMQMAMDLARGQASMPEYFPVDTPPLKVLYFDMEMTDAQISRRLAGIEIPNNFHRASLCLDSVKELLDISDTEDTIVEIASEFKPDVIFIDNISAIKIKSDTASTASPLMLKLNKLKKSLNVSILIVGHTPKLHFAQKLSLDQLAGSAQIGIQVDAAFGIGKGKKGERYLKQLKCRESEIKYDEDNVVCLEMKYENSLRFKPTGTSSESDLIFDYDATAERDNRILQMHSEGKSIRTIAQEIGLSSSRIHDIVKGVRPPDKLDTSGQSDDSLEDLMF